MTASISWKIIKKYASYCMIEKKKKTALAVGTIFQLFALIRCQDSDILTRLKSRRVV